jgi:peptide-methionine (S)-S-oxide reductase
MTNLAIFAAGCFWGIEEKFLSHPGVLDTEVGYTGGITKSPNYHDVCTGSTEHAEAVRVKFDQDIISYEDLLVLFFDMHDPTTLNRQGPDIGTQYRSEIFCIDNNQYLIADTFKRNLNIDKFNGSIVTSISMAGTFWIAEEYHQKYIRKKKNMVL